MPVQVFGNGPVQTSYVGYSDKTLTATAGQAGSSPLQLIFPTSYQDETVENLLTAIMDVTSDNAANRVYLPPANQVSVGYNFIIGCHSNAFNLYSNNTDDPPAGALLATLVVGQYYYVYLKNNTSAAGAWTVTEYAATAGVPNPSAIAGPGLEVYSTTKLATQITTVQKNELPYVFSDADRAKLIVFTGTNATFTQQLPIVTGYANPIGFYFDFAHQGSTGSLYITFQANTGQYVNGVLGGTFQLDRGDTATFVFDTSVHAAGDWWISEVTIPSPLPISMGGTGSNNANASGAIRNLTNNFLNTNGQLLGFIGTNPAAIDAPADFGDALISNNGVPSWSGLSIVQIVRASFSHISNDYNNTAYTAGTPSTGSPAAPFQITITPTYQNSSILLYMGINIGSTKDGYILIQRNIGGAGFAPIPAFGGANGNTLQFQACATTDQVIPYTYMGLDVGPGGGVLWTPGTPVVYQVNTKLTTASGLDAYSINANQAADIALTSSWLIAVEIGGFHV